MLYVKFKSQYISVFKIAGIFYCERLVIKGYTGANKNTECLLQSTSVLQGLTLTSSSVIIVIYSVLFDIEN